MYGLPAVESIYSLTIRKKKNMNNRNKGPRVKAKVFTCQSNKPSCPSFLCRLALLLSFVLGFVYAKTQTQCYRKKKKKRKKVDMTRRAYRMCCCRCEIGNVGITGYLNKSLTISVAHLREQR